MSIKYYNKLVRDKIPDVITNTGKACEIEVLQEKEYIEKLNEKLIEELEELRNAKLEEVAGEIADVMEVLFAIAETNGVSREEIENARQLKLQQRGGFQERILLKSVSYQKEKIRPKKQNRTQIPVNIYKGEELVKECASIQEAARWLKEDTGDKLKRYSVINNGIWHNEPYLCKGVTYYFLTDEESVKEHFNKK